MNTLFIKGLPENIEDKAFSETLDFKRDKVVAVKLARDHQNPNLCLGYGSIEFASPKDALLAMSRYEGVKLVGHSYRLHLCLAPDSSGSFNVDAAQCYIGNLSEEVTDTDIYESFAILSSQVTNARVMTSPAGHSLGYGFVTFTSREAAYSCVSAAQIKPIKLGRYATVVRETYQRSRTEIDRGVDSLTNTTIFCGNLHFAVAEHTLSQYFERFGPIASIRIVPNRGFGFVSFVHHFSALAALSHMQNVDILGQMIHCMWGRMRPFGVDQHSDSQYRTSAEQFNVDWASSLMPQRYKRNPLLRNYFEGNELLRTESIGSLVSDSDNNHIDIIVSTWLCESTGD